MTVDERPKVEIVARVLECIAEGRYHGDVDENGEIIIFPDYEPTFAERESFLSMCLNELERMRLEFDSNCVGSTLGENWSDFWTLKLLELQVFEGDKDFLIKTLKGKPYEDVVNYIYTILTRDLEKAERLLATGRETIPEKGADAISTALDEDFNDGMSERLASFHARRLSKQFCRIVKRAVELALLMTDFEVPKTIRCYIEEASKCYLYGQRIACLMVCLSTIEFAVRDRLTTLGFGRELDTFGKSPKGDSLLCLIELAKEHLPWQYRGPLEYVKRCVRQRFAQFTRILLTMLNVETYSS